MYVSTPSLHMSVAMTCAGMELLHPKVIDVNLLVDTLRRTRSIPEDGRTITGVCQPRRPNVHDHTRSEGRCQCRARVPRGNSSHA